MSLICPEIYLNNTVEVHKNVAVQVIIPKEPNREASIAFTRDEDLIKSWESSAHVVTDKDDPFVTQL
jgi:hypothetical protein